MRIFFSVGEPSGDVHGANLIRELKRRRADIECVGYGGPRMRAAGCELQADLTQFAVMWFTRVLLNLHHFWRLYRRARDYFALQRPDAVVLIDYPGFNWWIARAAKRHDIPVFYYGAPQIWAWARWRLAKMRRLIDHVLCKLPFEADWYREQGCHATYVGHPFFDETASHELDAAFIGGQRALPGRLVTILPGSRTQEVTRNLPCFLKAAESIQQQVPDARFAIAAFNEKQANFARQAIAGLALPIEVHVRKAPELIHLASCCLACSGSVSLQLLYYERPTVILYSITRFGNVLQRCFRKVKYITLVNLLAVDDPIPKRVPELPDYSGDDVPFPEYVPYEDRSLQIASHIVCWLTDEQERARRVAMLRELKSQVARPGASIRAADYILSALSSKPAIPAPHMSISRRAARAGDSPATQQR